MKKRIYILCFLMIFSFISCAHDTQNANTANSTFDSSEQGEDEIHIDTRYENPFSERFHYGTFEELAKSYQKANTDGFLFYDDSHPHCFKVTEQMITDRKDELNRSFSGYTYIPCYYGSQFEIIDSEPLVASIPSYARERFYGHTGRDYFYTEFKYTAAVTNGDGFKSYAYVYFIHGEENINEHWREVARGGAPFRDFDKEYSGDNVEFGEVLIDGRITPYSKCGSAAYILKYDEKTLFAINFKPLFWDDELGEMIDFSTKYEDHYLPEMFCDAAWLSNLSFVKYDFGYAKDGSVVPGNTGDGSLS